MPRPGASIFDYLPDPAFIVDGDLTIIDANASAGRLLGCASAQLVGCGLERFLPAGAQHLPTVREEESEAVTCDGTRVAVSVCCRSLPSASERIVVVHDISRWKSIQDDLKVDRVVANLSRMATSEFFLRMTHSLKTPLHAIIGFSDLLLKETGGLSDERHLRFARHINEGGHRLHRLIEDLLDLSRAESGRFTNPATLVHLDEMVGRMLSLVEDLARERRVKVEVNAGEVLPPVTADESRLKTAVFNVLDSLLRSAAEGGNMSVTTGRHGETELYLRFTVARVEGRSRPGSTTAAAIDDSPYAQSFQGTGLGIPLAARFVEMHGGRLMVEHHNGGTSVLITLPLAQGVVQAR